MSPSSPSSAALPIAYITLRILVVVNWVGGIAIAALLLVIPNHEWILKAFGIADSPDAARLVFGLRSIAVLGLVTVFLNYIILKRLIEIVRTVRTGDPFVAENANRLQRIAWTLFTMQILSLFIAGIAKMVSSPAHPLHLDAGFSVNGWLAVLLTFLLARVFAAGTRMREDLEGTV